MKNNFVFSITSSIGAAIGLFISVLICSLISEPLSYHEATLLAGSSIIPCFAGWFIGTIIYFSLSIKKYYKLIISGVSGTILFVLLYYYTSEPVDGFTVLSINHSKDIFPQLASRAIGAFFGLSLAHVLLRKFVPKYNLANQPTQKIRAAD